jgi:hypothetical protein
MDTQNLDIVLYPPQTITGTVRNARTREPVRSFSMLGHVGAGITRDAPPPRLSPRDQGRIYYDPAGRFNVRAIQTGAIGYWFTSEGYAPAYYVVEIDPGRPSPPLEVALEPEKKLRGIVVNPEGQPVAEVAVTVNRTPDDVRIDDHAILDSAMEWTGNDGRFVLAGLGSMPVTVWAAKAGFVHAFSEVNMQDSTGPELKLVLSYSATIAGVVTVSGVPATKQRVHASISLGGVATTDRETVTDNAGHYQFEGLRPGKMTLNVDWDKQRYEGFEHDYKSLEVRSGETAQLDFNY